ncbi:MAG TPA: redoxin domain-containing protein [Actinobacteria bacterium]|nr:redoxin domain-containing protein [Actinomycetota bacterium]
MDMERSKKLILFLAPILAIAAAGVFYFTLQTPQATKDTAPDFTVETLDGKTVSLEDLRGKPLFLNFWSSW